MAVQPDYNVSTDGLEDDDLQWIGIAVAFIGLGLFGIGTLMIVFKG
jgi:hypothetical protein